MNSTNSEESVMIKLYPTADSFLLGEPVSVKAQIINNTRDEISFPGFRFDWEELAFAPPNRVSLLDSRGRELASPYEGVPALGYKSVTVPPEKEEWAYLPLYPYFFFTREGEYSFSLSLQDNQKRIFKSDTVRFTMKKDNSLKAPEGLELKLETKKEAIHFGDAISFDARFTNRSAQKRTFLKPQQDSYSGWVNPVYQFIVKDAKGRMLPMALRGGSMATPVYDSASMFSLSPGESGLVPLKLPPFPRMSSPGDYTISLIYLVRTKRIGKAGVILEEDTSWDKDVFTGRIVADPVTIRIKAR
ncbi:MAG: hypothetical protein ACMUJM_02120 [bacterium]